MKTQAQVVIVGGGIAGTSIAYHLTKMGCQDVVLLERSELTSGSTFHAAGLVGQLRSSVSLTKMLMHSVDLYGQLTEETGIDTDWRPVGSLRLASTPQRMAELKRQEGWAKTFGLPMEIISPSEAHALFPIMDMTGVLGAAYMPTDGYADPSGLTQAMARGAQNRGAQIMTHTRVLAINVENNQVKSVVTDKGEIACQIVVNAGGMFAHEIGQLAGVNVPIIPMQHQYLITSALEGKVADTMPTMRDPDNLVYFRPWGQALMMGGYERNPIAWGLDGISPTFNGQLLNPDWDRFGEIMEGAMRRVPIMEQAGVQSFINGPEAFTPDGEFILGESSVHGFYVAAGFCAHGIAGGGGVGQVMAQWILDGDPGLDVWKMDIRRFGPQYQSRSLAWERTMEVYSRYYDIRYPHEENLSARPLRVSPVYAELDKLGASFGEKANWERVNWFESHAGKGDEAERPDGWAGQVWSPAIGVEHRAARTTATLFDETSFSKFEVFGPGSTGFLQRLCDNDIDQPVGRVIYTQMLNQRGGIECDLTVTRLGDSHYRVITGTAFGDHDLGWLKKHLPLDQSVQIIDVTAKYACLGLWGPNARDIISKVTDASLDNLTFPFMSAQTIMVGDVPCTAARVTYVGELGWEFYCPSEYGQRLWATLMKAGQDEGLIPGGYRAIDSLRLEKGYRVWGADITPETTPLEAGLGFCVKWDKGDFIGRDALLAQKHQGIERRIRCLQLDGGRMVAEGGEPIKSEEGMVLGRVTSGGYGYTNQTSIAYGYLPAHVRVGTRVIVDVMGESVGAQVVAEPIVARSPLLTS